MANRDEGRFKGTGRWVMIKWVMRGLAGVFAKAIGTTSILSILCASCANTTSISNA